MLTRRRLIQLSAMAPFMPGQRSFAAEVKLSHAVSLFDDIKYGPDFKAFDYVNATAPKGGRWHQAVVGSFDSLNDYTVKGDGAGVGVLDTLMVASLDEPATRYALIAEAISYPEDKSSVTFRLNPAARFHDGMPITVEDVIFSMETLKANLPNYAAYWKNVVKMEKTGEREVTFTFDEKNNRELPSIVSELPVLPKHWWQDTGPDGKQRNTDEPSIELPLGSGPHKYKSATAGATLVLERVQDYWAKDLPSQIGQNNFDEMTYIFYQTPQVAFESFKSGDSDYQIETSSKQWATGYDFPAVKDGRVVKAMPALKQVHGMQAYVLNLRRTKFQDVRVRHAMLLAFDFQWANANLFFGLYQQSRSFFNGSEFEAKGLPSPEELELLNPLKDKLPPEVFTAEYQNPVNGDGTARRKNLQAANQLLKEAGWNAVDDSGKRVLKNSKGEILSIDFALDNPLFERITLPYKEQLELLGFVVSIRTLDPAQSKKIQDQFDYDIIVNNFAQSLSPGNEQRFFFGSAEADRQGSHNYAGIKNEAIDALIEKLVFVKDRKALVTACRALDRVLMWNYYMVPQWFSPADHIAYWDRFGQPEKSPDYALPAPTTWWFDEAKAKKDFGLMGPYILKRLLLMIPTLLGALLITFTITQFVPGGPIEQLIAKLENPSQMDNKLNGGSETVQAPTKGATYQGARGIDPEIIKKWEKQFGFDKPAPQRFAEMVWNYARFDFGDSYFQSKPVIQLIKEKLPVSISLGLWLMVMSYTISIPLGIAKAVREGSNFDVWTSAVISIGYAIPNFIFAIMLIIVFAGGSYWSFFPLRGLTSDNFADLSLWGKICDYAWHITLPIIAMGVSAFTTTTMLTRNSFLDEIRKQYVVTARAKGLSESRVLYGHVFRNAMMLVIAGFPGAFISAFFTGSLLIEQVFSLDGLGYLTYKSTVNRDYAVVFASMWVFTLMGLVLALISDLVYTWIDPRIDFETREV